MYSIPELTIFTDKFKTILMIDRIFTRSHVKYIEKNLNNKPDSKSQSAEISEKLC